MILLDRLIQDLRYAAQGECGLWWTVPVPVGNLIVFGLASQRLGGRVARRLGQGRPGGHMRYTRREFGKLALAGLPAAALLETPLLALQAKPNSKFGGVQIGVITYSYRSMPDQTAPATLKYIVDSGLSATELMDGPVENFLGRPAPAARGGGPGGGGRCWRRSSGRTGGSDALRTADGRDDADLHAGRRPRRRCGARRRRRAGGDAAGASPRPRRWPQPRSCASGGPPSRSTRSSSSGRCSTTPA